MRKAKRRGAPRAEDFDRFDTELIRLLQLNARLSFRALAKSVGLSRSAVWDRLKRMERAGLIIGYQAIIAPSVWASEFDAVVRVKLKAADPVAFRRFDSELKAATFIVSARRIGRPGLYEIRAIARSAVDWLEATASRCGLVVDDVDAAFVVEEIVPHRAPAIDVIVVRADKDTA